MSATATTYYTQVADVWFQLNTEANVSGMVECNLDVRAVSSTSSSSQNLSWGIGYDIFLLLQVGSTVPESSGSNSTYGANTGYFTTSNTTSKQANFYVASSKTGIYNRPGSGWTNFTSTHALFFGDGIGGIGEISTIRSGEYVYCRAFVKPRARYGSGTNLPGALRVVLPYIKFQGFKK